MLPSLRVPGILRTVTIRKIAILSIISALVIDLMIIPLVLLKLFVFSGSLPLSMDPLIYSGTLGPATSDMIQKLENVGFKPVVVDSVNRRQFSVSGRLIALGGDSFQAFEYPDHISALQAVSSLASRYSLSTKSVSWKRQVHLYVNGNIAIYYFGSRESTVGILGQYAGLSITDSMISAPVATIN